MNVAQRIRICRMIEKMKDYEETCKRLGIEDVSSFRKQEVQVKDKEKKDE